MQTAILTEPTPKADADAPRRFGYRPREIARLYGFSHQFVYAEISAGRLKAIRKGRALLVLSGDLENWLASEAA